MATLQPPRWWIKLPETSSGAILNSLIRILLAPIFIALEVASLAQRLVEDEDVGCQGGPHSAAGGFAFLPSCPKIYKNRFKDCWRASKPLFFQGVFYTICLELFAALGLQHVLRHYREDIEHFMALLSGQWYVTAKGHRFPSSPSSGDVRHHLSDGDCMDSHSPRCPRRSTPLEKQGDCPCRAAFLIACCKLVYEPRPVVHDALERWGLATVSHGNIPANMHLGSPYAPDLIWFAASTPNGMVVAFAGAQVWLKIDRMTDIPCAMVDSPGAGRMNQGFVRLFDKVDPSTGGTVFDTLAALLEGEGAGKTLYLTGHSLGGIIAVTFAMLLSARKPKLAARLASTTSFGSPRLGDQAFAAAAEAQYGGRLFRYVCGCDMVVKLPGKSREETYKHHCGERFITWDGRVLMAEESGERLSAEEAFEDRWAYPLNILKLGRCIAKMDLLGVLRRLVLLPIPGLADHFPADYQQAIEKTLLPKPPAPSQRKRKVGKRKAVRHSEVLVTSQ